MKKKRFIAILCLSFILVFFIVLSSSYLCLKKVDIIFFDENLKSVSYETNLYLNTKQKLSNIVDSVSFDYGKSMFLLEKNKYINKLEFKNPFIKVLKIESVFPNTIIINASERLPFYSIKSNGHTLLCDNEFKVLDQIEGSFETINLVANRSQNKIDLFAFFEVQIQAFEAGQFLYENNLILNQLVLFYSSLHSRGCSRQGLLSLFNEIEIEEVATGTININFYTKTTHYGIKLVVENALDKFNLKIVKIINSLMTLREEERIKTTFGILKIDKNLNCSWLET